MDDFDSKLNTADAVVISQIISRITGNIAEKIKRGDKDIVELRILKDKCVCGDNSVNLVACDAILWLAINGHIQTKTVLSDFVTTITASKCAPNVAGLINNLLLLDLREELKKKVAYRCPFNLRLPQHPFIIMLNEDQNCWTVIFKEILQSYNSLTDDSLISAYNEAYKPLFLYTICDPYSHSLSNFKQKLWTFIIHNESPMTDDNMAARFMTWMQTESTADSLEINSDLIVELSELNLERNIMDPDLLILWQTSILYELILNKSDPRAMICSIEHVLECHDDLIMLNPMILILSKSILMCSSVYLSHLLNLIHIIVCRNPSGLVIITQNAIKAPLLHWIANSTAMTHNSTMTANEILTVLDKNKHKTTNKKHTKFYKKFEQSINSNTEIYCSLQLCILQESWNGVDDVIGWLRNLEDVPTFLVVKLLNFLQGLFLVEFSTNNPEIDLKIFALILKCAGFNNKKHCGSILTLILHKITKTFNSELHLQLLKALPQLVGARDNLLQKVVGTIQALNQGPSVLRTFSTALMFDLWKVDNKIYPFLETILIAPYDGQGDKWEFYVTRAYILKELCALRPELYGKEIVAHLSRILNECNNADASLACALAIDGITLLCKFEIIDAVTTWSTLAPMLKNDSRMNVIKSICNLIREIPSLSYTEAYPKLTEAVLAKLWEYLNLNRDKEVWEAALNAMTAFSLENVVAQMPEEYLDEEMVNIRKSGQVVPGLCWVSFLKNCDGALLTFAGDFLIEMVRIEIAGYLKFVYQVKGAREPADYSFLPLNSVVRGIASHIKSKIIKWKGSVYKEVYLECLRILSQEYTKPLPPLDWCFLQELVHEPEAKNYCIDIAAHQVVLSGTARRFIVNYLEAITQNPNGGDVLIIYSNLKSMANSIQPFTLKPFLEITIGAAVSGFQSGDEENFLSIISHLKSTLEDQNVQEANKTVIGQIISEVMGTCDISSKLFHVLLECITEAPLKCLDDISCPKTTVKEKDSDWFKKAVKVRCRMAIKATKAPLNLLNDIVEVASSFEECGEMIFEEFSIVFKAHKDNTECTLWMLELVGQIQAMIVDKYEKAQLVFLCDLFILATVTFSGHFIFLKNIKSPREVLRLFPRAIVTLLDINHWSICTNQALEWFYHMKIENIVPSEYREIFGQCLQSLRHEEEFKKNLKWIKYLNIECQ